jgi:hypothetical protein
MVPVIYTTYGIAMGHRPETLAASGGLRPAGASSSRERLAQVAVARARWWLETLLVRAGVRHGDLACRTEEAEETKRLAGRMLASPGAAAIAALTRSATSTEGERA